MLLGFLFLSMKTPLADSRLFFVKKITQLKIVTHQKINTHSKSINTNFNIVETVKKDIVSNTASYHR